MRYNTTERRFDLPALLVVCATIWITGYVGSRSTVGGVMTFLVYTPIHKRAWKPAGKSINTLLKGWKQNEI